MDANTRVESGAFLAISGIVMAGAFNLLNIAVALIAATGLLVPLIAVQLIKALSPIVTGSHKGHQFVTAQGIKDGCCVTNPDSGGSILDSESRAIDSDDNSLIRSFTQQNHQSGYSAFSAVLKDVFGGFSHPEDKSSSNESPFTRSDSSQTLIDSDLNSNGSAESIDMRSSRQKNAQEVFDTAISSLNQFIDRFYNKTAAELATEYTNLTGQKCPEVKNLILKGLQGYIAAKVEAKTPSQRKELTRLVATINDLI